LPQSALYRAPSGPVTARPPLPETDYDRAIESLLARLRSDAELPDRASSVVSLAVLEQWRNGPQVQGHPMTPATGLALRFASELLATRAVSDETFAAARDEFGERRLVNLIVLIGVSNLHCAKLALAGNACTLDYR
jgi:hypothetical protein